MPGYFFLHGGSESTKVYLYQQCRSRVGFAKIKNKQPLTTGRIFGKIRIQFERMGR